ncbi:MAG TPA: histidine phosphatase family protein [Candidatus Limnocylindrales bacterium]|nr:histidine phosphatase family protein [Candidatus Limnocylindrales bacterium]
MVEIADRAEGAARPRLWLVRHGETEWARLGRHTGHTDIPLTDAGRAQAAALAPRLAAIAFRTVLSSPLIRALETARIAGFADRVTLEADLREWDYGADEGRTTPEIRDERPGWTIWRHGVRDGEPIESVAARVDRVIARARSGDGDTLCFAHGHVLRVLAARWIDLPPSAGARLALATATISILGWERETPVISRWNDGVDLG